MMVINGGRMEQFCTPEEVFNRPATTFVAHFMCTPPMNLLKNTPNADFGGQPGTILGIRHARLLMGSTGWTVVVDTIEMLGAERLLFCRLGDACLLLATWVGETLDVVPRPDRLQWFDAATGKRL